MNAVDNNSVGERTFIVRSDFSRFKNDEDVTLYFLATLSLSLSRVTQNEELIIGYHSDNIDWQWLAQGNEGIVPFSIKLNRDLVIADFISMFTKNKIKEILVNNHDGLISPLKLTQQHNINDIFDLEICRQSDNGATAQESNVIHALRAVVSSHHEGYCLTLQFNRNKFSEPDIDALYAVLLQVMEIFIENKGKKLRGVTLICASDLQRVTQDFNRTQRPGQADNTIPQMLMRHVALQPDRNAVIFGDQQLSYQQLYEQSTDLARYLQFSGVSADCIVGIFLDPSLELMVGAWGVLLSAGAYLPLSPEYPEDRIKYMLDDSKTRIIFTQETMRSRLAALVSEDTRIITPQDVAAFIGQQSSVDYQVPNDHLRSGHLAYVIYTSGSTGKPKGVMIEHHSVVNQMHWLENEFHLGADSVILQKTPMSFDAAQWEILAPACGCTVIMGEPGVYKNPGKLVDMLIDYNVTILQCVPTLLQALLDTDRMQQCQTLTQIFSGGEALQKHLALECLKTLPHCDIINLYGPTECTINSSALRIDPARVPTGPDTVSIGTPIHNTRYYILDNCLTPVAPGQIGELYIGGEGLARGYLDRPELSAERFIADPFSAPSLNQRLYKSGDMAWWNEDGTVQYAGRGDNQVKLRGYRIELDEIKSAIETHVWVKNAAVILKNDPYTGYQNLISFIELNAKEAALMDQGNHGAHHQSKSSKAQVLMQLANKGCREFDANAMPLTLDLPGKEPDSQQVRDVFSRKTYRFFEGEAITQADILALLDEQFSPTAPRDLSTLTLTELGQFLRYLGQFSSKQRLLPKYAYASPGALYATQIYIELDNIAGLPAGYYYYNPVTHQLMLIRMKQDTETSRLVFHFVGKKSAIEPIYKNNIQEVLQIETGHIIGLLEKISPDYGLGIGIRNAVAEGHLPLGLTEDDYFLGSCEIHAGHTPPDDEELAIYVQTTAGKIADLAAGLYHYQHGALAKVADEVITKKQVIAINQSVYDRSAFGICLVNRTPGWQGYIHLGRKLQRLQMNNLNIGLMSSGYSSETGHDLPSAKYIKQILGDETCSSYFFVGGRISDEQKYSEGMKEDSVHMKGPTEMIRDDLATFMPNYMMPNKVIILNEMPLTVNGKIDFKALGSVNVELKRKEIVAPRNELESRILAIWQKKLKRTAVSVDDNFFEAGGNSLIAVSLINEINQSLQCELPLQVLFESPTVEKLAAKLNGDRPEQVSRLVPLQTKGAGKPVYCWPGLGGYCMNLRLLANSLQMDQPFFGVQAQGINPNEIPYATISEMAAADIKLIKQQQPEGPYTLWGYSFGARVAFEATWQLEQAGNKVENLFLIAPGSPKVRDAKVVTLNKVATFNNHAYLTILFSVFMGSITDPALDECLRVVNDETSFVNFIVGKNETLDAELVKRISQIVAQTFEFSYTFNELKQRQLSTPVTIIKAKGDDYSFIENSSGFSSLPPTVVELDADHYSMLKTPDLEQLINAIHMQRISESLVV
jgi:amino acid adenylation domain-containing protein